jgi:Tfp pilus assembly protein PilF
VASRLNSLTLHRETVRLVLLSVMTAAAFVLTAAFAAGQRDTERADAGEWFDRAARASAAGDHEQATAALRHAVSKRPNETSYVLALAAALTESGQYDAATRALLRVRAETPDDPIVNRAIARVAATRHDITAAVRYYHNALYGPWPSSAGPREIRLELIRFLLDNGDTKRAVSELIAATTDLPETVAAHRQLALLFAEAGEPARAFEFFSSALRLSPNDPAATEGAIATAFALGDYARAASYRVPPEAGADTRERSAIAALVNTSDPLARRLGIVTRRRRLEALRARVRQRAADCGSELAVTAAAPTRESARGDRRAGATDPDTDVFADAMEQILHDTTTLDARCQAAPLDRAIVLIARLHGINES